MLVFCTKAFVIAWSATILISLGMPAVMAKMVRTASGAKTS